MNVVEIPVTARPQTFTVVLQGVMYMIRLYWLIPSQCWVFDIMNRDGSSLIMGVPLVTGSNLIGQFQYIIKELLFVVSDHTGPTDLPDAVPDFTHLGITGHVYYRPPNMA